MTRIQRKLAAILASDVAGYSRLGPEFDPVLREVYTAICVPQ